MWIFQEKLHPPVQFLKWSLRIGVVPEVSFFAVLENYVRIRAGQPYFLGAAYNLAGPGPQVSRGPVGQRLLR